MAVRAHGPGGVSYVLEDVEGVVEVVEVYRGALVPLEELEPSEVVYLAWLERLVRRRLNPSLDPCERPGDVLVENYGWSRQRARQRRRWRAEVDVRQARRGPSFSRPPAD